MRMPTARVYARRLRCAAIMTWLCCAPLAAQQTYSRLTIIPQGDGSRGVFAWREMGGGADIFGIESPDAMSASYFLRPPAGEPEIGDALLIDSEPTTGVFQTAWGTAAGGDGCTPTGAAGELLFGDGAGGCDDHADLTWDGTDTLFATKVNIGDTTGSYMGASSANAWFWDSAFGMYLNTTFSTEINLDSDNNHTTASFSVRRDSATRGAGTLLFEVQEDKDILFANAGRWRLLDGVTERTVFSGSTTGGVSLGFGGQNVANGDVTIFAAGPSGDIIDLTLDWTSGDHGVFRPGGGDRVQLGTSTFPWKSGHVDGNWYIGDDSGGGDAGLTIEGVGGNNVVTFRRDDGGSNYTLFFPDANNAGALVNNGTGGLDWSTVSGNVTIGLPSSVNGAVHLFSGSVGGGPATISAASLTTNVDIQFTTSGAVYPFNSNAMNNGLATRRWARVYVGTAVNAPNGSDGLSTTCGPSTTITFSGGVATGCS